MTRYFFDIDNGHAFYDEVGYEFDNDQAVWEESLRLTRDLESTLTPGGTWQLHVHTKQATVLKIQVSSEWNGK